MHETPKPIHEEYEQGHLDGEREDLDEDETPDFGVMQKVTSGSRLRLRRVVVVTE